MKITFMIMILAILLTGCATTDTVRIDADGKTYLNGRQTSVSSLSESFKHDEVIINASPSSRHEALVAVLDELEQAGIKNVSVNSQNKKEK